MIIKGKVFVEFSQLILTENVWNISLENLYVDN